MPRTALGDVVAVEAGRGHLVQQGLEGVEVVGVDEGDVDGDAGQGPGGAQAPEAGSDDDDAMAVGHAPRLAPSAAVTYPRRPYRRSRSSASARPTTSWHVGHHGRSSRAVPQRAW